MLYEITLCHFPLFHTNAKWEAWIQHFFLFFPLFIIHYLTFFNFLIDIYDSVQTCCRGATYYIYWHFILGSPPPSSYQIICRLGLVRNTEAIFEVNKFSKLNISRQFSTFRSTCWHHQALSRNVEVARGAQGGMVYCLTEMLFSGWSIIIFDFWCPF